MAIPIEQITAPGKYAYDLAMEELEAELKRPIPLYENIKLYKKDCTLKDNYNTSFNITKK
jgi:hypothetical protein